MQHTFITMTLVHISVQIQMLITQVKEMLMLNMVRYTLLTPVEICSMSIYLEIVTTAAMVAVVGLLTLTVIAVLQTLL
jgi:hypothetical protein